MRNSELLRCRAKARQPIDDVRGRGEFVSLPGHLTKFPWVLPTFAHENQEHLLASLDQGVIAPAVATRMELIG